MLRIRVGLGVNGHSVGMVLSSLGDACLLLKVITKFEKCEMFVRPAKICSGFGAMVYSNGF